MKTSAGPALRALFLLLTTLAATLAAQETPPPVSIPLTSVSTEKKAPPPKPLSVVARCTSCDQDVQGRLTVDQNRVTFCCMTFTNQPPAKPGSKVTIGCSFSFKLPLDSIQKQIVDTGDEAGSALHIITSDGVDYTFSRVDHESLGEFSDRVQAFRAAAESHKVERFHTDDAGAPLRTPKLVPGSCN